MNKDLMIKLGFEEQVKLVQQGRCPFCNLKINGDDFIDEISKKEFEISGLCQNCQNKSF